MEFAYDGGGLGGGRGALYVDGAPVAEGRLEATIPLIFSADETADVGRTRPRPSPTTTPGRRAPSPARSTGCSSTSARTPREAGRLISPEERLRVAMARQ